MPFNIYNGRQIAPYSGPAPATSAPYYATYNGQQTAPYAGDKPGGLFGALGSNSAQNEHDKKKLLEAAAAASGNFAGRGEAGYDAMTNEMAKQRAFYNDIMNGQRSVATEQLRQGLQQQQASQMSMAAGASPQNAAMAARTGMMQMGRNQSNMAGQAAIAQLQEREMAARQLAEMNLGQRGQDINVGLGSRQNQLSGLGANKPDAPKEPSGAQKLFGMAAMGAGLFSDERLKTDVKSGDAVAKRALEALSAHTYRYKDPKHGEGTQLGVMAQALEKAGLKQAVVDTPVGKAVDTAKLTGANTSMLAALAKRVTKMERSKK